MFEIKAKRAILSRLFQAMVRERIIKKELVSFSDNKKNKIEVRISENSVLSGDITPYFSFGRFDLISNLLLVSDNYKREITHPNELLDLFKEQWIFEHEETEENFNNFQEEIKNSVSNLILAEISLEIVKNEFNKNRDTSKIKSSLDWVQREKEKDVKFSILSFYEQCVVQGHTLHPCSKTRFGLNIEELVSYSPEWRKIVPLRLVAVEKNCCQVTLIEGNNFSEIIYKEYPDFKEKIENEFKKYKLNFENYEIIPAHPWQFMNVICKNYSKQICDKKILPLESVTIPSCALVSFRSFAPESSTQHRRHHIKTSINLLTTSDVRTISPRATQSGPLVSKILNSVQKSLKAFQEGHFRIQAEVSGICYVENCSNYTKTEKAFFGNNLSCILRENPESYLNENEVCMPAVALLEMSPLGEKTILFELVEKYAQIKNYFTLNDAVKDFFKKYISLCLPSLLTLMSRFGISLEAHMQNSNIVFFNGEPVSVLIRDFSDIRISEERLEKQNFKLTLCHQNSLVFCKNVSVLHKNIFYSFFQNNIGELIIAIRKDFGIEENILWREVKDLCQKVFAELKMDKLIEEQAKEDEEDLFKENIQLKAMTKMRLKGEINNYYFADVENPICCS